MIELYNGHSPMKCSTDMKWRGYIYLARHSENDQNQYVKFGYVMSLDRLKQRDKELQKQNSLFISHVWSVTNPPYIESQIKIHLMAFLNKNRIDLPGKSEYVFSLPYDILKKVLCLLILVFHVRHAYLTDVPTVLKEKINDLFSGVTYLAIRSGGVLYQHQERLLTHAIELDKPGQEVIVVWGEHKDHPEWEHRIFIGTLQESSKPVKNKRSIRWIDANFMDTQDVPLEWIYVKNNKILAQPERTLNLDQLQEIQENNYKRSKIQYKEPRCFRF